ncbi:MAG: hypothetical protein QOI54_2249 [Actinomycetota bacterium]|nr:hypothetical protein [Actinomycetota bacterium]
MHVLELPPSTESVPAARRFVRAQLSSAHVDVDTAALLVSEVVTNAVLHARTALTLSVGEIGTVAHIEVADGSPRRPRLHAFSPTSGTGRGLRMLDQLAERWGVKVDPVTGGKVVWFDVGEPSEEAWADGSHDWLAEGVLDEH